MRGERPDCKWRGVACGSRTRRRRLKALQAAPLQVSSRRGVFQQNRLMTLVIIRMSRPAQIEFPDAAYRVMARRNRRKRLSGMTEIGRSFSVIWSWKPPGQYSHVEKQSYSPDADMPIRRPADTLPQAPEVDPCSMVLLTSLNA